MFKVKILFYLHCTLYSLVYLEKFHYFNFNLVSKNPEVLKLHFET